MTEGAWFDEYSTTLTNPQLTAIESVSPTAIRESGYWGGWYGLWYNDDQKAALTDPAMAERVDYILHRSRDEFFDLRKDPYSFDNLAENPEFATQLRQMKQLISDEMKRSGDPLIDAFENNTRYPAEWDKQ